MSPVVCPPTVVVVAAKELVEPDWALAQLAGLQPAAAAAAFLDGLGH